MARITDDEVAQISKALGDPNRLAIYTHIAQHDELFCGEMHAKHAISLATLSHHLKVLTELKVAWSIADYLASMDTVYAGGRYNGLVAGAVRYDGFPEWTRSERYMIEAKAEGTPGQPMMLGPMLQKLLEDRFRLKVHTETREGPVYILSVAKGGPKMQTLEPGGCAPLDLSAPPNPLNPCPTDGHPGPTFIWDVWTNMDSLTRRLIVLFADPATADTPVINKTGLVGNYHVHLEYTSPLALGTQAAEVPSGPSIFSTVEKLGLNLEAGKGPRQFLVFDHADKVPTEN